MVGVFLRSLSFPNRMPNRQSKPSISHHLRSISLPSRSHPLLSQIKDDIANLKTWSSTSHTRTSSWLCDGLSRLKIIHDYLDDILRFPQSEESLSRDLNWVEKLLDCILRFVDVYGIFQTLILALKQDHSAAHMAVRKGDEGKIAVYIKSRRRMAKEMAKLVSTVRCISVLGSDIGNAELGGIVGEVMEATSSVSVALFDGIAVSLNGTRSKAAWMGLRLLKKAKKEHEVDRRIKEFEVVGVVKSVGWLKKGDDGEEDVMLTAMKSMQSLEICVGSIECCSDSVFRSLIALRVSLLNALTR